MVLVRGYRSETRAAQARATRAKVLAAARELFVERGYGASTMRDIAALAEVSVPTVELLFGRKSALLKAAIDVAIAGDDEPIAVLDRPAARAALESTTVDELLGVVVALLGPAQERSAGLVLAAFEAAPSQPELRDVVDQLVEQRARTAAWIVERVTALAPLRRDLDCDEAIDSVWVLLDSALFDRLTRHRGWDTTRYQRWMATTLHHLLVEPSPRPAPTARPRKPRSSR